MILSIILNSKTQIHRIALVALLLILCNLGAQAQLKVGDSAPEIRLPDSLGKWTSLSSTKSDIVLVHFWAARCPSCVVMAQELKKIKAEFKSTSFEIYALSLDFDYWRWINTVRKLELPFIHVNDAYGLRSPRCKAYDVVSIPQKILIQKGKIKAINPSLDEIRAFLKK